MRFLDVFVSFLILCIIIVDANQPLLPFFLLSPGVLTKSTGNLLQGEPGGKMNVFFLTPPDA